MIQIKCYLTTWAAKQRCQFLVWFTHSTKLTSKVKEKKTRRPVANASLLSNYTIACILLTRESGSTLIWETELPTNQYYMFYPTKPHQPCLALLRQDVCHSVSSSGTQSHAVLSSVLKVLSLVMLFCPYSCPLYVCQVIDRFSTKKSTPFPFRSCGIGSV